LETKRKSLLLSPFEKPTWLTSFCLTRMATGVSMEELDLPKWAAEFMETPYEKLRDNNHLNVEGMVHPERAYFMIKSAFHEISAQRHLDNKERKIVESEKEKEEKKLQVDARLFAEVLKKLLFRETDITESDEKSCFLRICAKWGTKELHFFLSVRPQALLYVDEYGETPLMIAARAGKYKLAEHLLRETRQKFPQVEDYLERRSKLGMTALLYAARSKNLQVVELLIKEGSPWTTDVTVLSKDEKESDHSKPQKIPAYSVLQHAVINSGDHIVKHLLYKYPELLPFNRTDLALAVIANPDVAEYFLDNHVRKTAGGIVTYHYDVLNPPKDCSGESDIIELMVRYSRANLIKHIVVERYLSNKWATYRIFFFLEMLIYFIFTFIYTAYGVNLSNPNLAITVIVFAALRLLFEIYEMIRSLVVTQKRGYNHTLEKWVNWETVPSHFNFEKVLQELKKRKFSYFRDLGNILEWYIYVVAIIASICTLTGFNASWVRDITSLGVTVAWINGPLYFRRLPFIELGIFSDMYLRTMVMFGKFLIAFCFFILAFAFGFNIVLDLSFGDFGYQIITILNMLFGDFEAFYQRNVFDSGVMTALLYVAFLICIPLLLLNLLIGLSVGEAQGLKHSVSYSRAVWIADKIRQIELDYAWTGAFKRIGLIKEAPITEKFTQQQEAVTMAQMDKDRMLYDLISKKVSRLNELQTRQFEQLTKATELDLTDMKNDLTEIRSMMEKLCNQKQ